MPENYNFRELIFETFARSFEERRCPDQQVGLIGLFSNQSEFQYSDIDESQDQVERLIMILESPHINEYDGNVKPAKGRTGRLIREHILNVVGLRRFRNRKLLLLNAIQNQCSLGFQTKKCRDKVFSIVWNNGGKELFRTRLRELVREGDVIVNCCTKGNTRPSLRYLVQETIENVILQSGSDIQVLKRTHPSSWHKEINRQSVWD